MGLFKSPVRSLDASTLNGKDESQLNVAYANNSNQLDGMEATEFATTGDIPIDYGDVVGPEGSTAGNIPLLDVTGKILSDSSYAPDDFATTNHTHAGYVATSDYEDLDVLNKIKNVDGLGSGLDADTWRGLTTSEFIAHDTYYFNSRSSYYYLNVMCIEGIVNSKPESPGQYETYMVGSNPSGDWQYSTPGTLYRYDGSHWYTVGDMYDYDMEL